MEKAESSAQLMESSLSGKMDFKKFLKGEFITSPEFSPEGDVDSACSGVAWLDGGTCGSSGDDGISGSAGVAGASGSCRFMKSP